MKRVKKPKQTKYEITEKQLKRIKEEVTREATEMSTLLVLAATQEVKALTEDDICNIFNMVTRWTEYIDDKLLKLKDVQEVIEKKTGVKLKGWA